MRNLLAMAPILTLIGSAFAQPIRPAADAPAVDPDPLYRVEVILYAFDEGNPNEEDLFHGTDDLRFEPVPRLLRLPKIELQSLYNFGRTPGFGDSDDSEAQATVSGDQNLEPASTLDSAAVAESAVPGTIAAIEDQPFEDRLELFETEADPESLTAEASLPIGFRPLTRDELELVAVAQRMNRRPYSLLGYAGWQQAGVDTDRSIALDLKHLGITNVSGTIEVSVRRFHRVFVDLEFFDGSGTRWDAPAAFGLTPLVYAKSYKLVKETTAIRSGTLHYIDHPLFGALVRITPAPEPEDEAGGESGNRPAG